MQNLDFAVLLAEYLNTAQRGVTACAVRVIGKYDIFGIAVEQARLIVRQGCAKRSADVSHAVLVQRNRVHIAFNKNGVTFLADVLLRDVKRV